MSILTTLVNLLNADDATIILQREQGFALLSWRDLNQPPAPLFNVSTCGWLFVIGAGLPLLILS